MFACELLYLLSFDLDCYCWNSYLYIGLGHWFGYFGFLVFWILHIYKLVRYTFRMVCLGFFFFFVFLGFNIFLIFKFFCFIF